MTARYIVLEGTEGVGKSTQTQKLYDWLRSKNYSVLLTKEPGTPHSPLTMELRNIMLNAKYDAELTKTARELIAQSIRSIHLEQVIRPALSKYDFIIQDRGMLSGLSYGQACDNELDWLESLCDHIADQAMGCFYDELYTDVIFLTGDVRKGLAVAQTSKQEFEAGDAIEKKGVSFMENVRKNMDEYSQWFNAKTVSVDGKSIDTVFEEIISVLKLGNI